MRIPLASPDLTHKEKSAVLSVLNTPTLSLGPKISEFEKKLAEIAKRRYAIAVNSGTSALHLIVRALGISQGDEVITTPFSFIASANCILYERAKPVFVDIEEDALNIDPAKIEKAITKRTKAILAVDVFGRPAKWGEILHIAKKHKLKVIEDSAEALGSFCLTSDVKHGSKGTPREQRKPCGSFGDAAIFSFYPNKAITTGEGGVILTDNKKIADFCRSMANQGREVGERQWLEHVRLGYNYRMTEMQAALGLAQLNRLKEIIQKRKKIFHLYGEKLKKIPGIIIPQASKTDEINWFVYVIRLAKGFTREDRNKILKYMAKKGIQCGVYFPAIHLQPLYRKMFGYKRGDFPITEFVSDHTLALPFFNTLTERQIDIVVKTLKKSLEKLSR